MAVRVAVLSDVHANLAALDAVLAHAREHAVDAVWSLGDMVGYGPRPNEVLARLRDAGARCLLGNHDAAAAGIITTELFNTLAAEAAEWTARVLLEDQRSFLRSLPRVATAEGVTLVHGTLHDPLWEYLISTDAARRHFALAQTRVSFVGHTHIPLVVWRDEGGSFESIQPGDGETIDLGERAVCVNPGGAGQPRDGDPRAAYAVFQASQNRVEFYRVVYDMGETQRQMRLSGLPDALAARLAHGR